MTVAQLLAPQRISDPNRIYAGQRLRIAASVARITPIAAPPKPKTVIHVVHLART